jgi:murein DD-endopeptidase MepM/ murein hydrolase activator NlpD
VSLGAPIYSVKAGTVVSVRRDLPENTPPSPLTNLDVGNALGNHVSVNIGGGLFAIYGHMRSVAVRVGERVRRGQRLGQVGNSGGSTAPHLHFQITHGLRAGRAAVANGVPFETKSFRLQGRIRNIEDFLSQETSTEAIFGPRPKRPLRKLQLPMQTDVVTFP